MPKVSIIIPTHNRPHLLPRAIESTRAAGVEVEVIVVDDASQDQTAEVCRTISDIKYIRLDRNHGVAGARNFGLVASTGEFITFLDDDDLRIPGSLAQQVKVLDADKQAGVIYGQAQCLDQAGEKPSLTYPRVCLEGDVFWDLLEQNFIPCGSAVFRRACLGRVGLLDSSLSGIDDWDLWIRLAELYPFRSLNEPVLQWKRSNPRSQQGSSNAAPIVAKSIEQFKKRWVKLPRAASASTEMRTKAWKRFSANMAAHLCWEAIRSLHYRSPRQVLKNFFALMRLGPFPVVRLARYCGDTKLLIRILNGEVDSVRLP